MALGMRLQDSLRLQPKGLPIDMDFSLAKVGKGLFDHYTGSTAVLSICKGS